MPRSKLLHDMYLIRPWHHEISDAAMSPHMRGGAFPARFKPPAVTSIAALEQGTTALRCMPTWTTADNQPFDHEGQKIHFIGNKATVIQRITDAMNVFASQQPPPEIRLDSGRDPPDPLHPPLVTYELDARAMMRRLRKRMIMVIIDQTGELYQGTISPSADLGFVTASPWTGTHFAILISSGADWIPLKDIPIIHLHHPPIPTPVLEAHQRIYTNPTPSSIDTKRACYSSANASTESACTEARNNSIFPWRGVQRQPKPHDHSRPVEVCSAG